MTLISFIWMEDLAKGFWFTHFGTWPKLNISSIVIIGTLLLSFLDLYCN